MPHLALIEDLTATAIPPGKNLLIEYDSKSQWYAASLTMAAEWLKTGGEVIYNNAAQHPDTIRSLLNRLGLDIQTFEKQDKFRIYDHYVPTLGQKSKEKYTNSLKVADMSITFSQHILRSAKAPELLRIWDNASTLSRFNDEKNWVEFELTRRFPTAMVQNSSLVLPVIRGIHSEWAYKQLEANADAIIDFRLDETADQTRNLIRISNFRNLDFDSRWHQVKIKSNGEAVLSA